MKGNCKNCNQEVIIHARGLCRNCYHRFLNSGELDKLFPPIRKSRLKKCKVEGCERYSRANGYCQRHYLQIYHKGEIKGNPSKRRKINKNEIVILESHAEIILYDKDGYEKNRALIDIEDVKKIKSYSWNCNDKGYVCSTNSNKKRKLLHRFIMNCNDDNLVVDHINHNPLDNRKCNLRICTPIENGMNLSISTTNTTGIIGLFYIKGLDKWQANITINTHVINLGTFDNKEDAIKERLKGEVVYFKEFAPQKHLYEEYGIDANKEYKVKEYTPRKEGNPKKVKGIFKGSGKYKDKWKVEFKIKGKNIYLGYYDDLDIAIKIKDEYMEQIKVS